MNDITYAVSVDVNNPIIPYNVYVASVLDSNVRYLEITLYQNGNVIVLSNEATATASLVTDNVLVDDSVECTISNNIISVPLEDLQRHGNLDVQVTVTEGTKVLAIPFPIQVRVTPNIAENAQIDENSLGSYAEVVQEIAAARGTHTTLHDAITAKLDDADGSVKENNIADESITVEKVADDLAAVINAKEVKSNKKTTLTGNEASNDYYPTTKAVADALSGKAPAATAFTFDDTTTTVTFNENNPKIIYLNATVDNEKGIVLTSADNTVQYFFGVSKSVKVRNKNGASTYTPWELALEKVGNKKNIINSTNLSSTEFYPSIKAVADYLTANYEALSNKLSSEAGIDEDSTDTKYPSAKAVFNFGVDILDDVAGDLVLKENLSNKKNAIAGNEMSEQYYPSTKAVVDYIATNYEALSNKLSSEEGIDSSSTDTEYPTAKAVYDLGVEILALVNDDISNVESRLVLKESASNKQSSITAANKASTALYPSIKAVVDYLVANYEDLSNKLTSEAGIDSNSTDTEYPTAKAVFNFGADILDEVAGDLVLKENLSNKKNAIAGNETSGQYYPTTKAVYDYLVANYENLSNKLTSEEGIDSNSTDTEYPTAKAVYDFGADIKSAFNTFEIECYEREESSGQERQNIDLSFTAGSYPKATHNTVTIETGISDIKYAVTSVVPGETIHVHCQNNWMARAYLFADSSGKGLSWFPENSISPTLYDTDVVVPENAATMYIMGKLNTDVYAYRVIPVPAVITFNLDVDELMEKIEASAREELVVSISNDTLSVSNGVKTVVAGLHASNNGGFSFGSIYGKNASDDVCPVKINGSYVGGNHGFTAKIIVTNSNGHGKTIADIGSVYERSDIPGREYVIVSVPSTTQLCLIRRDGSMEFINSSLSFTFTHVSGGTNTDPISFTSLSSYQQLQPGINNIDLAIFADATMITSGETKCNRLKIVETYNIMSLAEIADYLIDNVGQNDNTSYYDDAIAGIAKRTTVYEIIGDMSITVSDYLQSLGAYTLSSMGIVQSQMLGTKFLAPYTTYSGIQTITSNVTIDKQVWSNEDVPPHKIYQLDTTNDIKGQLMLYPPFGLGVTAQRVDALGANGTACTIDGSTKKFYPIFYGKNIDIAAGTLIGGYAIRTPFQFDENGIFSFVYKIAGKTYAEIECLENGDYYASVGTEHSVIRNIMAKQNIVLNTETIIDGKVYFHCIGNGSITLEIA